MPVQLFWRGKPISDLFQAAASLGTHENDMSRSIAWAFARCPAFLNEFLCSYGQKTHPGPNVLKRIELRASFFLAGLFS